MSARPPAQRSRQQRDEERARRERERLIRGLSPSLQLVVLLRPADQTAVFDGAVLVLFDDEPRP